MIYKYITINGSGFNIGSFFDFFFSYPESPAVLFSHPSLSLVSGKANLILSESKSDFIYSFPYSQASIVLSDGKIVSSDRNALFVDGVQVPFVIDSDFFLFMDVHIRVVHKSFFSSSFLACPSSFSPSPVNVSISSSPSLGSHYEFSVDFNSNSYSTSTLLHSSYIFFSSDNGSRSASVPFTYTSSQQYAIPNPSSLDNNGIGWALSCFTLDYLFSLLPSDATSFSVGNSLIPPGTDIIDLRNVKFTFFSTIGYFAVGDRIFNRFFPAFTYALSLSLSISDLSSLFNLGFFISDYSSPDALQAVITELKAEIVSNSDTMKADFDLEKIALKTSFDADILALKSALAIAIDEASISTGQAKVNETISSGLTTYYQSEIDRLTLAFSNTKTLSDSKIATLEAENQTLSQLSKTKFDALVIPSTLTSLNGSGSEFIDGTLVKVDSRPYTYVVIRSFNALVSDNSYTVIYDLLSDDGHSLSVPEALVIAVTPTVTAP